MPKVESKSWIFSNNKKFKNEFYGASYACVRDEFRIFKRKPLRRKIKKVTITLGGVDSNNNTFQVIDLIRKNKVLKKYVLLIEKNFYNIL